MKADKDKSLRKLKIVKGQIEGIIKMVEDDRYCIDISNQLLASISILKGLNIDVIQAHINHCVTKAIKDGDDEKINEIIDLIKKIVG